MDYQNKIERPKHPRVSANIFQILTFSWTLNLFKTGRKRDLEINDIYQTLSDQNSSSLGDELEKRWSLEVTTTNKSNKNPSLLRTLIHIFGVKFMFCGFFFALSEFVLRVSQPLFIGGLLAYFNHEESNTTNLKHAYINASCLALNMILTMILFHYTQLEMHDIGMKVRIATCAAIYRKSLRLSQTSLSKITIGQLVNLLSNDVNRFDKAFIFVHFMWISPLQVLVSTYFIWQEIGISSLCGLAACFMFTPLQGWLGKKSAELRLKTAIRTDDRVRLMNEIILGIHVIKMYTWEKPFTFLVKCARKIEIKHIKGSTYIKAALSSFVAFHTKIILFCSLISFVMLGNNISTQKVFVITSYYSIMQTSLTLRFPQSFGMLGELLTSIKRLQIFLLYEEKINHHTRLINYKSETHNNEKITISNEDTVSNNMKIRYDTVDPKNVGIVISDASAKWTSIQIENTLQNINLIVKPSRLVGIIGPVGGGKSSLIQTILQELPLTEGSISVSGVVSYASQEPWLFAGSIRQNILFGLPKDKERYNEVIKVCALKTDFEQLPYGDRTIVGERGVSLSGGQRARINLARAIYKQADIYLLDDPLSAVDTLVGKHLFDKCIKGYLKDKICILVTHQLQYLADVNQIVHIDNGNIIAEGTYQELQKLNLDFNQILKSSVEELNKPVIDSNSRNKIPKSVNRLSIFDRQISIRSVESSICETDIPEVKIEPVEMAETRSYGNVSLKVYCSYISAGGRFCKILFFIFICIFTQILISSGDLWITFWVNLEEHYFNNNKSVSTSTNENYMNTFLWWSITRKTCIIVFAGLTIAVIVVTTIRSFIFVSVCMNASMNLHNKMFDVISRATMYFFNINTSGRILNRFSKDIGTIDDIIPALLIDSTQICLSLMGIIIIVGIVNIYLMVPMFIIAFIFYKLSVIFLATSRGIKRLEGTTRSPVYAHLNASLQGLTTIRAFEAEQILSKEFDDHQDLHSSVWYLFLTTNRAFGLWLDTICIVYISIITFSFIVIKNEVLGGNVGLAITQAIGLLGWLQLGIRQSTELENQMTSVERVLEYTNIPQEDALESSADKMPAKNWPSNGKITFKHFYLRYNIDAPYVIKNLNINIESQEKIGIVGRTGAGKSSLIGALFRLALNEGNIIIDDIEIHEIGLHDLRSKLSIIPQEPVLFSGTLRKNLDPFDEYPDHIIWNALDEVELKSFVEDFPCGINSKVADGGSNFSVGQRQLVCLARAIVRNNKILVLDEATANVDPQTDSLIQNTIRNKFRACTVLTIAHRLNTVMDSDKVLVMDAGIMVEFDHPFELLKNKNGFLYKMVEETGRTSADLLHSIAARSYETFQTKMETSINVIVANDKYI